MILVGQIAVSRSHNVFEIFGMNYHCFISKFINRLCGSLLCCDLKLQDQISRLTEENGSLKQNLLTTNSALNAVKNVPKVHIKDLRCVLRQKYVSGSGFWC